MHLSKLAALVATALLLRAAVPGGADAAGLQLGAYNADAGTISAVFIGWRDPPPCVPGKTTFIWWENPDAPIEDIAAGREDDAIRAFGEAACPGTIVAPFHEFNLVEQQVPWSGKPAAFRRAWRRIHDILGDKVRYAWVMNNWTTPGSPAISDYYPGDGYVDIVGIDAFAWVDESFAEIVEPVLDPAQAYGKPVWVTSFGTGQNQAAFLADAVAAAKAKGIGALIYFSEDDGAAFHLTKEGLAAFAP